MKLSIGHKLHKEFFVTHTVPLWYAAPHAYYRGIAPLKQYFYRGTIWWHKNCNLLELEPVEILPSALQDMALRPQGLSPYFKFPYSQRNNDLGFFS